MMSKQNIAAKIAIVIIALSLLFPAGVLAVVQTGDFPPGFKGEYETQEFSFQTGDSTFVEDNPVGISSVKIAYDNDEGDFIRSLNTLSLDDAGTDTTQGQIYLSGADASTRLELGFHNHKLLTTNTGNWYIQVGSTTYQISSNANYIPNNELYNWKISVNQTHTRMKVWPDSQKEPESWTEVVNDRKSGDVGVKALGDRAHVWISELSHSDVKFQINGTVNDTNSQPIPNATVEVYNESGQLVETKITNESGQWNSSLLQIGEYTLEYSASGYNPNNETISLDGQVETSIQLEKIKESLEVQIQEWMYPNTTQTYKGIYLPDMGYQIVTSELNVTSSNTSVIQVNESTNELIAQPGVNNTVNVTFQYKYFEVTKEMTVSHRTLEYIHILPATQWAAAILGVDDAGTEYGMGSEMQWIFVAIIVSSLLAAVTKNEWVGLATTIITMSFLWVLDYVGLGMVLATLFFGLFLAFTLMDVPRNSKTEVQVEGKNLE